MKKVIIRIVIIVAIIIGIIIVNYASRLGLAFLTLYIGQIKPSDRHIKKEITAYLDKNLDEKYEIKNIIKADEFETVYSIYIPDDDVTVPIEYNDRQGDGFSKTWGIDCSNFEQAYYNAKFIKASNDRKALFNKYPDIIEKITYDLGKTPEFNICIDNIEHADEIYGYLTESYKLNNYKLYTDIEYADDDEFTICIDNIDYADSDDSNNNDKKGNRYFNDYSIDVHIFVDNKEVLNMQYSDIREKFECKQDELYNFIPKEKLIEQIEKNYNDIVEYGDADIIWRG